MDSGTGNVRIITSTGEVDLAVERLMFSAFRCYTEAVTQPGPSLLWEDISNYLSDLPGTLALYKSNEDFFDRLIQAVPGLVNRVKMVITEAPEPANISGLPVTPVSMLQPGAVDNVFLCEAGTEKRWRIRRRLEGLVPLILCPDITPSVSKNVSLLSYVKQQACIYPLAVPEVRIEPDLDVLLLDLPGRNNFAPPLGFAYVHKTLKRTEGIRFQTFDADLVMYHRFHIRRIFDLGEENLPLDTGRLLHLDPWEWFEECWLDSRLWPALRRLFSEDIDELVARVVEAKPKVLALSVHQRNEWSTREVARRVKEALPETMIVAGGHSCLFPAFAVKAFPEHDYIVIGEAEMVFGELVRKLARGERPIDLPGIVSRFDTLGLTVEQVPVNQNLDEIGAPEYDWFPDFPNIYKNYFGRILPYTNLTRGCIWSRCTFCGERFRFRQRSANSFVDEIEHFAAMGITSFSFGDSDFGGRIEELRLVAEEIIRRGLKVTLGGQIRVNPRLDEDTLRLMVAAGITTNFGVDALTRNTLKLQRKGYSIDTLKAHLVKCANVGIKTSINLVVGTPGETEQDIGDTIQFVVDNRNTISDVFNISAFYLMMGSVYWDEPEKHGIIFYGDRAKIYDRHFYGVPDDLWCSVNPYIDSEVRTERCLRVFNTLHSLNIPVSSWATFNVNKRLKTRYTNVRDLGAMTVGVERNDTRTAAPWVLPLTNHVAGYSVFAIHDGLVRANSQDASRITHPKS